MGRVDGLVAIVTGAAAGMGLADAQLLAEEGAKVVLTDINEQGGRAAAESIGAQAFFVKHDVSSEAGWGNLIDQVSTRWGQLDILVNNAGMNVFGSVEDATLEQFRFANSVMSEGVFLGCKYAIPLMAQSGGGSIINTASIAARVGFGAYFPYSAAKGAVLAMTRSIAVYCQQKGYKIRCNAVLPGAIETAMMQEAEGRSDQPHVIPDGVLPPTASGAPRDIAEMVLYLASPQSRFVTGAEFVIDNGAVVRPSQWDGLGNRM